MHSIVTRTGIMIYFPLFNKANDNQPRQTVVSHPFLPVYAILQSEDAEVIAQIEAAQNQIIAAWKASGISSGLESFGSAISTRSDLSLPEMMLGLDYFALRAEKAKTRIDQEDTAVYHDDLRRIAWCVVEEYPNSVFRNHALSQYLNVHLYYMGF